ncbi:MAG: ATP-binding protein [Pseudonocardiaceae bacterium]
MEVSSPGGFPEGIRLDNLLVAAPQPRSPLLADAFKRTGLVERTGRGINRMFAEQLRVGRPAPDYGRSTDRQVVAVLPGGPARRTVRSLEQKPPNSAPSHRRRQTSSSGVSLLRANLSGEGSDEAASTKSQLTVTGSHRERSSTPSR